MTSDLAAARTELRARLGSGARYDDPSAPAEILAWARLGTSYFARVLNSLDDNALAEPSLQQGRSRAFVVGWIGYQARAMAELCAEARGDSAAQVPDAPSLSELESSALDAMTLPARALRNLFDHAAVHLNVEWRDLDSAGWDRPILTSGSATITPRAAAWTRARELWLRSLDLNAGGSLADAPAGFVGDLLREAAMLWTGPRATLRPADRPYEIEIGKSTGSPTDLVVSANAADLALWLTGREGHDVIIPDELSGHTSNLPKEQKP